MFERTDPHLPAVEALMRQLCTGEHSEITGQLGCEHLATGGKRLRARLALATVDALGAPMEEGVAWAAACELLHNATLIHDDLQDGDRLRRGKPTVWAQHGMAHAINAGDLLLMLPYLAVEHGPADPALRWRLCRLIARQASAVIRGQSAELVLNASGQADEADYERAIRGKTSALFELPAEGAALVAGRTPYAAARLAAPFRDLGMLFQMQDDVLDLFGDKGRDVVGSDLREGKTSALVVAHLAAHPEDAEWLSALLQRDRDATPTEQVQQAIERFRGGGALAAVVQHIGQLATAVRAAPELEPEPALRQVADELLERILQPIAHVMG